MILSGFIALISILIVKSYFTKNHLLLKFLVIGIFVPNIDYSVNSIFFPNSDSQLVIFHSIFLAILFSILLYAYSEYRKNNIYKIAGKGLFLGILIHNLAGNILWFAPLNQFWPIIDADLKFSIFSNYLFKDLTSIEIMLFCIIAEIYSLILYNRFLIIYLIKNKGNAKEIKRISRFLKFQSYTYSTLLCIFFIGYFISINVVDTFLGIFSIFYINILIFEIYTTYKTNFKLI